MRTRNTPVMSGNENKNGQGDLVISVLFWPCLAAVCRKWGAYIPISRGALRPAAFRGWRAIAARPLCVYIR